MDQKKAKMYEKEFKRAQETALRYCDEAETHHGKDDILCESAIRVANYWTGVSSGIMTAFEIERKYELKLCKTKIKRVRKAIGKLKSKFNELENPYSSEGEKIAEAVIKLKIYLETLKEEKKNIEASIKGVNHLYG